MYIVCMYMYKLSVQIMYEFAIIEKQAFSEKKLLFKSCLHISRDNCKNKFVYFNIKLSNIKRKCTLYKSITKK